MPPKKLRFNPIVDECEERESDDAQPTILHSALRPGECLALDFSLPSSVFRADPRLDSALMSKPACSPPESLVTIRVASAHAPRGLCTFPVIHNPEGEPVTVGDVLTTIRDKLRQLEATTDRDVEVYHARRVRSVDAYLGDLDAATRRETRKTEEAAGPRRVDHLRGNVLFDGVVLKSARLPRAEPDCWLVDLQPSSRYAAE